MFIYYNISTCVCILFHSLKLILAYVCTINNKHTRRYDEMHRLRRRIKILPNDKDLMETERKKKIENK